MLFDTKISKYFSWNLKMAQALVGNLPSNKIPPILGGLVFKSYFWTELYANYCGQFSLKIWSTFEIIWFLSLFWKYFASTYCQSSLRSFSALLFYSQQRMLEVICEWLMSVIVTYLFVIWHCLSFWACFRSQNMMLVFWI